MKRMVDLDELLAALKKHSEGHSGPFAGTWTIEEIRGAVKNLPSSDASASSPEHRTLTGLPVELAALKERVEKVEKTNAILVEAETRICDRLVKLEASVKALASPVKPEPPKPVAAAAPKQEWKVGDVAEFDLSEDGTRSIKAPIHRLANGIATFYVLGIETQVLVVSLRREDKAKWERINAAANALGDALQKDANRLGVPLGAKMPGGDAYVELLYALKGETNPLRTSGGGK